MRLAHLVDPEATMMLRKEVVIHFRYLEKMAAINGEGETKSPPPEPERATLKNGGV